MALNVSDDELVAGQTYTFYRAGHEGPFTATFKGFFDPKNPATHRDLRRARRAYVVSTTNHYPFGYTEEKIPVETVGLITRARVGGGRRSHSHRRSRRSHSRYRYRRSHRYRY